MNEHKRYGKRARGLYRVLIVVCTLAIVFALATFYLLSGSPSASENTAGAGVESADADPERVEDGIHVRTGLIAAEGYREVVNNCTACHSAELVIQNRMDSEGWEATIKWMQEAQNLWDLGDSQAVIIKYLVTNYPVEKKGRRAPLKDIEWYSLGSGGP
jgi:lipopolysaccharide export LptBFGC system permease protein LptF